MAETTNSTRPNVTVIRGGGKTTVYDNETRKVIVEADEGNKSSGGFSKRGRSSSGQTISIDQKGTVSEEIKSKPNNSFSRPTNTIIRQNGYTYKVTQQGGFELVSRPIQEEIRNQRTIELNKKINRGEKITAKELALGENEIPLLERNRQNQIVFNQRVSAQSQSANQQAFMRAQTQKQIEQQRNTAPTMFGFEPVAQKQDKTFIYSTLRSRENFNLNQQDIGTNIRSGRLSQATRQPRGEFDVLKNKSDRDFALRFTAYATKTQVDRYAINPTVTGIRNYGNFLETRTVLIDRKVVVDGKERDMSYYADTTLNRFDVPIYAMFKNAGLFAKREEQMLPRVKNAAIKTVGLAFAGGDVVTRKIPYVNAFYGATVDTAKPFIEGAIRSPASTYGLVRGPAIFGKRAYAVLDYADVAQSVGVQGVQGYFQGGVGGAVSGAIGGYAGERVSDRSAFFAQGGPTIPTYRLSNTRGQSNTFVVRPQGSPGEFTVLQQYKPRFVYGQEFTNLKDVGTVKQRFKITKRQDGLTSDGLFYPTTEAPDPIKVTYDQRLMSGGIVSQRSIADVRRSLKDTSKIKGFGNLGKRGQLSFSQAMGGGQSNNFQGTQPESFQDTLQQPISQLSFVNPIRSQTQEQSFARNYQKANQRTMKLSQLNANVRTRSITGFGSLFTSRSQSRSQAIAPSMTQFLGLSQTRTQSQTLSQTMTQTLSPSLTQTRTMTQLLSPTLTQTQTMTQTLTRTPTITETPTITPTFNLEKAMFGNVRQSKKSKGRQGRYTQSFASLFLAKPKGFSRSSKLARSGIGVRF